MDILSNLIFGIIGAVLGSGAIALVARAWRRTAARRRWCLAQPSTLRVIVAASGRQDTGEYPRPTTGIGQARALATIAPSLARAYRAVQLDRVFVATDEIGRELEGDLILLGGPKTNRATQLMLEEMERAGLPLGVTQHESKIETHERAFEGTVSGGDVTEDFGLVIRTRNPLASSGSLVILSGSHTFGTGAAARFFVEGKLPRGDFALVVRSRIEDRHALPPQVVWRSGSD